MENLYIILVIIFWTFTILQQRSDQRQVKRNVISTMANVVYELPHQLPNDLRLRILRNNKILGKSKIWVETAQCSVSLPEIKLWQQQSRNTQKQIPNVSCTVQFYWISLFCFKYFAQDCRLHYSDCDTKVKRNQVPLVVKIYSYTNGLTNWAREKHGDLLQLHDSSDFLLKKIHRLPQYDDCDFKVQELSNKQFKSLRPMQDILQGVHSQGVYFARKKFSLI